MVRIWKKQYRSTSQLLNKLSTNNFKEHKQAENSLPDGEMERPKAMIEKSRVKAIYRACFIHLVPVTAALVLIILNYIEYYAGSELSGPKGYDDFKFSGLLFAAKLHEVLMVASLGFIVFTYVQEELVNGEGVPFAALGAGLQMSQITFIFQKDFWCLFWAHWERRRKKWTLVALLLICTLLGLSVAPSSANLMRPRLDNWPSGGTKFWLNATDELFLMNSTDQIDVSDGCSTYSFDLACPYGDWDLVAAQYHSFWEEVKDNTSMPEKAHVTSSSSSRNMEMRHRSEGPTGRIGIWNNRYTVATVPQSAMADAVTEIGQLWLIAAKRHKVAHQFEYRNDVGFFVNTTQPISQARCNSIAVSRNRTLNPEFTLLFPRFSATCQDDLCEPEDSAGIEFSDASIAQELGSQLDTTSTPMLRWLDVNDIPGASNASIYAVALFPNTTTGETKLYSCSIDARHASSVNVATRNNPRIVDGVVENFDQVGTYNDEWPRIRISTSWASLLNPDLPTANSTVFSETVAIAGMWNSSKEIDSNIYKVIVESVLVTMITNGLGRASHNVNLVGELKDPDGGPEDWMANMIPDDLGPGRSAYKINASEESEATEFEMRAEVNGLAWSHSGTAHVLSIVILLIYVLIAVAHTIYMIVTGLSIVTWTSMTEITSVAMSSNLPDRLLQVKDMNDSVVPLDEKFVVGQMAGRPQYIPRETQEKGSEDQANEQRL